MALSSNEDSGVLFVCKCGEAVNMSRILLQCFGQWLEINDLILCLVY